VGGGDQAADLPQEVLAALQSLDGGALDEVTGGWLRAPQARRRSMSERIHAPVLADVVHFPP
jgi:hypothetical protein